MDTNMSLSLGFKGQLKLNAQAVPLQEGYLKLGGIAAENLTFGTVCSAPAADPTAIVKGKGDGNVIRGIVVFDDAIAQNAIAHPGKYLAGMPCAFINKGLVKITDWEEDLDPVIGYKVEFNNSTGALGFVSSSAGASHTLLAGAVVVEVTDDGAYVWLG